MEELTENKPIGDKIHVSILGSCVLRDTIGYYHEGEKFVVDRFVQDISPLSMVGETPLLKPLNGFIYNSQVMMDGKETTHFIKRNITLDLEKNALQYISESHSEWLLVDVICLRRVILKYKKGFFSVATSGIKPYQPLIDLLLKEGYLSTYKDVILPQNMPDNEFYSLLDKFVEKLKEYYPQDKIILFNVRATKYCAMRDGLLSCFPVIENYNAAYKGFEYLVSKLPKAHIIDFPVNTISDENHKWGRADLHYVREYYDYAYAALEQICGLKFSSNNEEQIGLTKLKVQYERIIDEKYKPYFVKTINGYSQYKTMYENLVENYKKRSDYFYNQLFIENCQDEFLRQECDLLRYVKILKRIKSKYLIVLAVKDTAGNYLTVEEVNAVKDLGFSRLNTKPQNMYIGVVFKDNVIFDKCGVERWQPVEVTIKSRIEGQDIKLSSMAWQHGNKAEIIINDIDYAVNMRGLNFVVYDTEDNKLIDSVAFDYHAPTRTCRRNKNGE